MTTLDARDLTSIDGRILVHGEEEAFGRSYLMLEGTEGHVYHIYRETAREMIRGGVYPRDGGWNGWLGRYQKALVDTAFALEREKAKERGRSRSRDMGTLGVALPITLATSRRCPRTHHGTDGRG